MGPIDGGDTFSQIKEEEKKWGKNYDNVNDDD